MLAAAYTPVWLHLSLMAECRERTDCALNNLAPCVGLSKSLLAQLHAALGLALIYTMGSADETAMALGKALEVLESLDDADALLRTLWALWILHVETGECRTALSTAEHFSRVASRTGDAAIVLVADRLIGNMLHFGGRQNDAQRRLERVVGFYVEPKGQRHTLWFRFDQGLLARAMLARVLWLRGIVDQAIDQAQLSLEEARTTDHKLSLYSVFQFAVCPVALFTGDFAGAERSVATMIEIATSLNSLYWMNVARCVEGKALIACGQLETGSAMLHAAIDMCERTRWTMRCPEFLGALAEGLAGLGRRAEALVAIERALAMASRGGELWYAAELLRIKGELLLADAGERSTAMAEDCFRDALELAREQTALSWELRTATSLARLRIGQDRPDDARKILTPVYDRFTEGFKTADLRAARAMLDSLSPHRAGTRR